MEKRTDPGCIYGVMGKSMMANTERINGTARGFIPDGQVIYQHTDGQETTMAFIRITHLKDMEDSNLIMVINS